jgi:hypothetical protein
MSLPGRKPASMSRRRFLQRASGLLVPAMTPGLAFPGVLMQSGARVRRGSIGSGGSGITGDINGEFDVAALAGQDFGVGPTTVLFDPLNSGTSGATVATSRPLVGTYDAVGGAFLTDTTVRRHGSVAVCSYSGANPGMRQLDTHFDPAQVVAGRYWWYIPVGSSIPDAVSDGAYSSVESSYKLFWLRLELPGQHRDLF